MNTRRQFLGAAAALSALPLSDADPTTDADADTKTDGGEHDRSESAPVQSVGGVDLHPAEQTAAEVHVQGSAEAVSLRIHTDVSTSRVMLLPEDVDRIIEELAKAKQGVNERDVAQAREWIVDEYKEPQA